MKIEIKNLSKSFKNTQVLNKTNLTFEDGKIYGIIGRNGSGKSVFFKMLCGFYKPTTGTITFNDKNYIKNNEFPNCVRALIEKPSFLPNLTGYENLELLSSIQNKIGHEEIVEILEEVNLLNEKDKLYSEYSLGMKQKLGIAQALMEKTDVIILDEPFNGIEEESVTKIKKTLKLLKKEDKLIFISSHIKEDLDNLADKIYLIDNGEFNEK